MKKNLIVFIVIIIAFLFFQHRSTPNIPIPAQYNAIGSNLVVKASMGLPNTNGETWNLTQRADKTYIVNVYNNGKLVHSFYTGKQLKTDVTGTTYGTGGTLMFDRSPYSALNIRVNVPSNAAYITFKPIDKQSIENG